MIRLEDIKQAIEAIAARDREIGLSLDEMLGSGRLDVPGHLQETASDPFFLFDNEPVPVRRISFLQNKSAVLEQRLLLKFGELAKKEELVQAVSSLSFWQQVGLVRRAGYDLVVIHELNYAGQRAARKADEARQRNDTRRLEAYRELQETFKSLVNTDPKDRSDLHGPAGYWFAGEVNIDMPAYFLPFACHWDFLRQVAALNLEFFHLRFVLDRLLDLQGETVFIALVKSGIAGMMAVDIKSRPFYHGLEISHIATVRENRTDVFAASLPELRGVGSFLVAGLWLLWKQGFFEADEIVLDSEIESRGFYKTLGFELRRQVSFVLRRPSTSLLTSILSLLENAPGLEAAVAKELEKLIRGEIDRLAQQKGRALGGWPRAKTLRLLAGLLQSQDLNELRRSALQRILQKRNRIPEAEELLAMSQEPLPVAAAGSCPLQEPQLLIVRDDRFLDHLSGIFHLESPNRLKEIHALLDEPAISQRCLAVESRAAVIKELMWVHSREYIRQVALTAKQRVSFLDADTQTTPGSYQTACLAAGSVFNLLERLMAGHNARGFAFVRPPGHHATRDQGMGFCLFNNAALGARYLQERFGLQRILILDLDAHHGNGIQEAFYDTDRVLYISLHQFPAYPGTGNYGETGQGAGEGFTVNVPLPSGQGDLVFARIVQQFVRPLALTYQPEIILAPFGFDLYSHDRLAGMKVTPEGYGLITSILLDIAAKCDQGRIAFILEGGYSAKGVRSCALKVLQELCGLSNAFPEKQALLCLRQIHQLPVLKKVLEVQKAYWHCLL